MPLNITNTETIVSTDNSLDHSPKMASAVRTLSIRFADVVTLADPCEATPAALLSVLKHRFEGVVHAHGYILPGSLTLAAHSSAECGVGGSVTFRVWVFAQVVSPCVGDRLEGGLRVLVTSPLGTLCAVEASGFVWVFVPAEDGTAGSSSGASLPYPVVLTEVVQRTGGDGLLCFAERAPCALGGGGGGGILAPLSAVR